MNAKAEQAMGQFRRNSLLSSMLKISTETGTKRAYENRRWAGDREAVSRSKANQAEVDIMKALRWVLAMTVGTSLLAFSVRGAEGDQKSQQGSRQIKRQERSEKAIKLARTELPDDIKNLVDRFQAEQKAKLEQYRKLSRQATDGNAAKREQLRDQLRQLIENQREEREKLRDRIRERLEVLADSLPNRKELIEAAREPARDNKGRAKGE